MIEGWCVVFSVIFYSSYYFAKKSYGQYKEVHCTFCEKMATQYTENQLPVCRLHLKGKLDEFKCLCGSWLEQRSGKYGPYFNCIKCGIVNYKKGLEMRKLQPVSEVTSTTSVIGTSFASSSTSPVSSTSSNSNYSNSNNSTSNSSIKEPTKIENSSNRRKETTITTDDVEYFS
ncbi:hypothetical protein HYU21_00360 [Candidatus Woesearchaeota archaeon]|nr:hypothetical protein [Candidatus Woesearchaeota archaeon]